MAADTFALLCQDHLCFTLATELTSDNTSKSKKVVSIIIIIIITLI